LPPNAMGKVQKNVLREMTLKNVKGKSLSDNLDQ